MKTCDDLEIMGKFVKKNSLFIFKDKSIICNRKGSTVEVNQKKRQVIIIADVTGIDKVYFEIKNNKVRVSDRFKDFAGNSINQEFLSFQEKKGYVPYPFTILNNVRKAPPGLRTVICLGAKNKRASYSYEASDDLSIFDVDKKFRKKSFRKEFEALLRSNLNNFRGKRLVSSFSGGFDSLLLTHIYDKKCEYLLHFNENNEANAQEQEVKAKWPKKKWVVVDHKEKFSQQDLQKYFQATDEPCYDYAGLAEYLMARRIARNNKTRSLAIMNGQGADGLFCSGRHYFQAFVSGLVNHPLKTLPSGKERSLLSRLSRYGLDAKARFISFYLDNKEFSSKAVSEFESIYSAYSKKINNDSTNLFAILSVLLKYPLHGIEKIKTASRAFNQGYYLPFMSVNVMKLAFSIPSRYKVSYGSGKRILISSFPEIKKNEFRVASFLPRKLNEKVIGKESTNMNYEKIYTKEWLKYLNIKHNM